MAYAYWLKKRADRLMPRPQDIDAVELRELLPFLSVVEVLEEEPVDYYYRIDGEATRTVFGYQRMGRRLSEFKEVLGPRYLPTVKLFESVCSSRRASAGRAKLAVPQRQFYEVEWVHLPLSRYGAKVERILTCLNTLTGPDAY